MPTAILLLLQCIGQAGIDSNCAIRLIGDSKKTELAAGKDTRTVNPLPFDLLPDQEVNRDKRMEAAGWGVKAYLMSRRCARSSAVIKFSMYSTSGALEKMCTA